jgi:hypothetical protein
MVREMLVAIVDKDTAEAVVISIVSTASLIIITSTADPAIIINMESLVISTSPANKEDGPRSITAFVTTVTEDLAPAIVVVGCSAVEE